MEISFWKSVKENICELFDLVVALDERAMSVITEGFQLACQDVRDFFAD